LFPGIDADQAGRMRRFLAPVLLAKKGMHLKCAPALVSDPERHLTVVRAFASTSSLTAITPASAIDALFCSLARNAGCPRTGHLEAIAAIGENRTTWHVGADETNVTLGLELLRERGHAWLRRQR
jgi:hypothetical protein